MLDQRCVQAFSVADQMLTSWFRFLTRVVGMLTRADLVNAAKDAKRQGHARWEGPLLRRHYTFTEEIRRHGFGSYRDVLYGLP